MRMAIMAALAGVVVLALMVAGGFAYRYFIAPVRGAVEQQEITNQGQYRIQAYEQFYRWDEEVISIQNKLAAYPNTRSLNERERTECRGLLHRRADIVTDYNAAARAELTRGKWQAPELPEKLTHWEIAGRCQ